MGNSFQLKSFWNFLKRNKLFTAINIFGFAVSLTFVILMGLYVQDELSVNDSQSNKERVFWLRNEQNSNFSCPVAADLKNRYPEIEATMRIKDMNWTITDGTRESKLGLVLLADSSFVTMFDLPWVEGSPEHAMRTRNDVIISEACARTWFGSEPALGKTIRVNDKERIVTGVYRDLKGTHFKAAEVILPFENVTEYWGNNILTEYGNCSFEIYIMTRPNVKLTQEKVGEMRDYLKTFFWLFQSERVKELIAEPVSEVYFTERPANHMRANSKSFLLVLSVTALLILLFAVINYINLSVAQSGFRAQEAATRRLLGGSKGSLFAGFILESLIICFVSLCIAVLLAALAEPWFQQVMWTKISVANSFTAEHILLAFGGIVVIGVISGLVPAYVLTRFKPIDVVRGTFRRQTKMVYSKVLIAFQYCITIVLLGATITIVRQLDFMCNSDLGFDHDNILVMDYSPGRNGSTDGLRNVLMAVPGVEKVGFAQGNPVTGSNNNSFEWKGKNMSFQVIGLDSVSYGMMNFKVLKRTGVDDRNAVWLNNVAWNDLELTDDAPVFKIWNNDFKVAGILEDYHIDNMEKPIGSVMVRVMGANEWPWDVLVQVSGQDQFAVADRVREEYVKYNGGTPVESVFMDEAIQRQYSTQKRMAEIITSLSLLAILISALGMLAMSTYFMRQRAQEVAVRKVFGATDREVLTRLVMSFLKLVLVAFVVAVPVIWYFMNGWLSGYAYRIPLSWSIFALAGLTAFVIAFVTVLWQSLKATRANPILSIRD